VKCSELVFVQHNPLYDDYFFDQHSVQEKLNKTSQDANEDTTIFEPTFQEFSFDFTE
jgi:hypothetical protein